MWQVDDKRVIDLIKRCLKAGVMENGLLVKTEESSPQGGPLSPLLANIYLYEHEQDTLFKAKWIRKRFIMETYYLVDFENVHNDGIAAIENMSKSDHVHIFSTPNATNIRQDVFWMNQDIMSHLVPVCKQSLDMHLVSYLGYLLGIYGKDNTYVIISKDKDYDNIIKFWKDEGYPNVSRMEKLPGNTLTKKKETQASTNTQNSRISAGLSYELLGDDRSELNLFMQHGLAALGYDGNTSNRICKFVIAHCNDERVLYGIHNELKETFDDYVEVYKDVKNILEIFVTSKNKNAKRESQIRTFFEQHFRKKIYVDHKEEIVSIILNAKNKQQVNNELMKVYSDGNTISHIYQTIQPLIKDMPGK